MKGLLLVLAVVAMLSGTAHGENRDTPEAVLLDQDRLNSEQADRQMEAVQKQIDSLDQMNRLDEPDRYEAEDLDHARWMWEQQGLRK